MADPRVKQLAFDALALSLTGPIELLGSNQPRRSLLGEDAVTRNLRSPILDNFQEPSMTAYEPTTRERLAAGTQTGLEFLGMRRPQARSVSQGIFGGPSSPILANLGVADVVPFVGTALQTEEAVDALGRAGQLAGQGQYGQAAVETGMGILGLVPGAQATNRAAGVIGDRAVQAITGNPQATAMGALEAAGQMAPLARIFSPEQAKKVIPETKVVDESGDPIVMYHGTQRAPTGIDEFGSESGYAGQETSGLSWFTSSPQAASGYANWVEGAGNPTVYPVYLSIKNPASINDYLKAVDEINKSVKGRNFVDNDPEIGMYDKRVVEKLKDKGFDGVSWTDAEYTGQTGFATDKDVTALPFSSKQIKSAISDPAFAGLLDE